MVYSVEIKNISARVGKMTLAQGETTTLFIKRAESPQDAIRQAVRKLFDGCGFHPEDIQTSDGSVYGQITYPCGRGRTNLYGRIYVFASETQNA